MAVLLGQNRLTVEQQKRSMRLLHILRQTFAGHDKSSLSLQKYVEGEQGKRFGVEGKGTFQVQKLKGDEEGVIGELLREEKLKGNLVLKDLKEILFGNLSGTLRGTWA